MRYTGNSDDGIIYFAIRGFNAFSDLEVRPAKLRRYQYSHKLLQQIGIIHKGDPDAEEDLMDTISEQCQYALKHLSHPSPANARTNFTLQDYYGIKITCLELSSADGKLKLWERQDQTPQPNLLPEMAAASITSRINITVPLVSAAQIRVLLRSWRHPDEFNITAPTLVQVQNADGSLKVYHFKQAASEQIGLREDRILLYLKQHQISSNN